MKGAMTRLAVLSTAVLVSAPAFAEGDPSAVQTILSNFDVSDIATFAVTAGAAVVGIALAIKGIQYAKRFVRMS